MTTDCLFPYQPGINRRKEQALRMLSDGHTQAEVCLELRISHKTLSAWIKAGLPAGDPDLDQLSFVDGMTERERQKQR
jgi:Homeodomain-like domain